MKSTAIIGYTYDASVHCVDCTRECFPGANAEFSNVVDLEANDIHPIFAGDEQSPYGEFCEDCGWEIYEPDDIPDQDEDGPVDEPDDNHRIYLTNDGTMDTVLKCSECGKEFRYTWQPENNGDETYDDFVEWAIEDAEGDHACGEDDVDEEFFRV